MKTQISQRLKTFFEYIGFNNREIAMKMNMKPSLVKHFIGSSRYPGTKTLTKIARVCPELNLRWLLLGDGEMIKNIDYKYYEYLKNKDIPQNLHPPQDH